MSGPPAAEAFSAHAEQYTALRRRLVPGFDGFYTAAVQVVRDVRGEAVDRVLDLGAVHVSDMAAGLPDGPYDAIISALAIHHLVDDDKRALMRAVHHRLAAGGVFVNAEQVVGPTAELTALYDSRWETQCRALGAADEELAETRERMRHDHCRDVETQLGWLRDAGFRHADCAYRAGRFAVLFAIKEQT